MPPGKRLAAIGPPRAAGEGLGTVALRLKLPAQLGHRFERRIAAKDVPYDLRLGSIDQQLFAFELITDRRRAAHPQTFFLGRRDLVPDALPGHLALELSE